MFNPKERKVYDYTASGRRLVTKETLHEVSIDLADLYADLNGSRFPSIPVPQSFRPADASPQTLRGE